MKPWWLRLHRWLALIFALPLIVVMVTGLILSFEPAAVTAAIRPGTLTEAKLIDLIGRYDPSGKAGAISYRSYDNTLSIGGRGNATLIDGATGERQTNTSTLADVFGTSRRIHEHLVFDGPWLVVTSSVAMLVMFAFGLLMGWPRISNSLAGWHKAVAWGLLPLLILSPLTGVLMSAGVTFTSPAVQPSQARAPSSLAEQVRIIARDHDLSNLIWLRPMRGQPIVRLAEGGEYRLYNVTAEGLVAMQRNWPRLWHEGNFAGVWSSAMNVIISLALIMLLVTGLWIWARRKLRLARRRRELQAAAA